MSPNPCYKLGTFRTAYRLAKFLPRPVAQALAGMIGRAGYAFSKGPRAALRENLRVVSGLEGEALDGLCRRNFVNFIKMLADYFYCTTDDGSRAKSLVAERRGDENLKAAFDRGKGVILITAHLGNWEMGGILLALRKIPLTVVTLNEPTTELTLWRDGYRRKLGIKTVMVGSDTFSFVEMIKTLRANEGVAMLVDRPYEGSGTPVRFFGRETLFSTGPALLWQHTDAAVVPAFVLQNKKGRYLSFAEKAIPMQRHDDQREALAANTQLVATAFEAIIREHPEQWFNYVPIWKTMKASALLCIALAAFVVTGGAPKAFGADLTPAEVAALLKQLQEQRVKQPCAQADFTEEKTSHLVLKPLVSEGSVAFEAPDKFRRDVKGGNSSLSVSDGKTMWVYYPNFKEAEHYAIGQHSVLNDSLSALTAGLNFDHIEEFYNFHASRDAQGYQFQLNPKRPELRRLVDHVIVLLDNDFLVRKVELYQQNGDHVVTVYRNVRRAASLPAGTFEFTPPVDVHISYPLGK